MRESVEGTVAVAVAVVLLVCKDVGGGDAHIRVRR